MMDSASALPAAPTPGGAYKPVAPKPLRAGRFGMVRTMGMCGPNQRASAACGMPAATEMSKGLAISKVRLQREAHGAHLLRLHREDHHLGARCGARVVGRAEDAVAPYQPLELLARSGRRPRCDRSAIPAGSGRR